MRQTILIMIACLTLTAGTVWAPYAAPANATAQLPRHTVDEHLHGNLTEPTVRQAKPPCTSVGITMSPGSPQAIGTAITLEAALQGCNPSEYRWLVKPPNGTWTLLTPWGSAASYVWQTSSLAAGNYDLGLHVRDVGATSNNPSSVAIKPFSLTAPPPVVLHEGVPICADHNPTAWHPLVERDGAGAITCTYGHEHHADPNAVNDIFGPPGAWYGGDQEISYPWQTSSALGLENHVKHEGYKWYTTRDMECKPSAIAAHVGCIRAFRALVHALGTHHDATSRFHSYSVEALVEHNGITGIVRHGGWTDFGHLALNEAGANTRLCPPLTTNPETFNCGNAPARIHSGGNFPEGHTPGLSYFAAWYSFHLTTQLSTAFEEWGPIDYQQPSNQLYFPAERNGNNSRGTIGNLFVQLRQSFLGAPGATVNFNGYTNRAGVHVPSGCTAPGVDCVPFVVEGASYAEYQYSAGLQGTPEIDYDIPSPVNGKSLVRYPN